MPYNHLRSSATKSLSSLRRMYRGLRLMLPRHSASRYEGWERRRGVRRFDVRWPMETNTASEMHRAACIVNVSVSGLLLESAERWEIGECVPITIMIKPAASISCMIRIVRRQASRSKAPAYGAAFQPFFDEGQANLHQALLHLRERE